MTADCDYDDRKPISRLKNLRYNLKKSFDSANEDENEFAGVFENKRVLLLRYNLPGSLPSTSDFFEVTQ